MLGSPYYTCLHSITALLYLLLVNSTFIINLFYFFGAVSVQKTAIENALEIICTILHLYLFITKCLDVISQL